MGIDKIEDHHLRGLWKRAYIKIPAQNPTSEDHETEVYWFQAEGLYADLRIPLAVANGIHTQSFFHQCEGFAGISSVRDNVCTWQRFINLQGPLTNEDIGRVEFGQEGLYETGLDDSYVELWKKLDTVGDIQGQAFQNERHELAILIWSDIHFLLAIDCPDRLSNKHVLNDITAADTSYGTYCFGHFHNDRAVVDIANRPQLRDLTIFYGPRDKTLKTTSSLEDVAGPSLWCAVDDFGLLKTVG